MPALMARGKAHNAALVACARKLLIYANTVVHRGTPWTDTTAAAEWLLRAAIGGEIMTDPHRHWDQGHKYVVEGVKVMLLINGGAAAGLLTFIGHTPGFRTPAMAWAITSFGIGALLGTLTFLAGYLAQLFYGNEIQAADPTARATHHCKATIFHTIGYIMFAASALSFLAGLILARIAMSI
jgi:hypothetical protein